MKTEYTLREFIRMTPPQKVRLQKRDPDQYEKLRAETEKNFSKETDQQALTELNKK
jgi:ornithine cyclodeaminase/alanine dehydrogenase-like protein (mu-crystallin family)